MSGSASLVSSVKPPIRSYPHFKTHHLANELVKAARLELRDSGNLAVAYENLQNAYDIAIAIIRNVYVDQQGSSISEVSRLKQQGVPLGVAEELVEILHYDKIQQEFPLIYIAAKTLRIFLDLTFLIGKNSSLKIDPETHKNMVLNILDIFETLPSEEARTNYELRCCLAAAIVLNDDFVETKAFALANVENVVKAFAKKSPGELAKPMLELASKSYRLADTSWWTFVFPYHLTSRVVFSLEQKAHTQNAYKMRTIKNPQGQDTPDSIVKLYLKMHEEHLSKYKNYRESAFCVLEDLEEMVGKTIRAGGNDSSLPVQILEGDGQSFPGIREFIVIETPKFSEFLSLVKTDLPAALNLIRRQTYWKVQYRAIDILFNVATDMLAQDLVWKTAITILVNRPIPQKKNKKVEQLYQRRLQSLKQNFLPERAEFTADAEGEAKYKDERLKRQKYNDEINKRGQHIREVVAKKRPELEDAPKAKEKTREDLSKKTQEVKNLQKKISEPKEQGKKPGEETEEEKLVKKTYEVRMDEEELALLETKEALLNF